ncbi:LysR family transcriptional regulator [Clostridium felsineum]|uniref:Hydrogen peroxide-inducible genes activator n=1 Tax=Clostridium felsineum TaxID=36839 RepID=A0A1S8L279_9CLOT|nr:LysR family transcriptional regulator [Clostridium felsineum]MCR3758790.1 LysR family transcriptional regulator [Clostridium felsineum]URZ05345.1 Hydrogen peroxide-inducible genes activator [Clostridium felsineum]URZ10386.1 Hydrogen peroxide-inducible genes activator [Clostridium felsineum]
MNLKDLEYFKEIAKERSFTKVAERLGVSQPTVTYAIKRLEEDLGTKLITRDHSHKEIILTQAGKVMEIHTAKIFQELKIARTEINRLDEDVVNLGLPPIIGNAFLHKLFPYFFEQGLMEHINLVNGGSNDLYAMLMKGEIELALLGAAHFISEENLVSELLTQNRFMIVVNEKHHLANKKNISISDLKEEKFVLLNQHYIHLNTFRKFSHHSFFEPEIIYKSNDLNILKGMIREGLGIGFLAEIAIDKSDGLIYIPFNDELQPSFNVFLVRRKNSLKSNQIKKIFKSIHNFFE